MQERLVFVSMSTLLGKKKNETALVIKSSILLPEGFSSAYDFQLKEAKETRKSPLKNTLRVFDFMAWQCHISGSIYQKPCSLSCM